jgi:branched-chain amino acid transport system substrate-binding protein
VKRGPGITALVIGVVLTLVAGCGTRLPDSAFGTSPPKTTEGGSFTDGVSGDTIRIGMVDTVSGPLGPDIFDGPMYGAQAYFRALNAHGGIDGRKVEISTCDDGGSGSGNVACVHKLIDKDGVFALSGVSVYDYAGASYVNNRGVPDIGGEPIGTAYDQYRNLYSIYGSDEPRDGTIGWDGKLYAGTEVYRYFKQRIGAHEAAVVYYNESSSAGYADSIAAGLKAEGFGVVREQIDFSLPNYAAAVADMRAKKTDIVFDAMDTAGNASLCQAMDGAGLRVLAKVTTVQGWNDQVRSDFAKTPQCRNELYATSSDRNYADTKIPAVAAFRAAMNTYFPGREPKLSMWELEGYAGAMWLTDAIRSCQNTPARACVTAYMNQQHPYTAGGLILPTTFTKAATPPPTVRDCLNVARWQDSADNGKGGWVTQVPNMNTTCYTVPNLPYSPN